MPTLICYDIATNALRTKLGKKITEAGLDRINKSVYLGTITESSLTSLEKDLAQLIHSKGDPDDSLIVLPLTAHEVQMMHIYGHSTFDKDELDGSASTIIY